MGLKMDIDEFGVRYENLGPETHGLPMHEHAAYEDCHNVEVLEGEIVLFFDNRAVLMRKGDVFSELDVAQRHAIWPNGHAVWYNRRYGPQPRWLMDGPETSRHTVVDQRIDLPKVFKHYLEL